MENNFTEYSEGIPSPHRLVLKVIGFLNSKGGEFIVGINNDTQQPAGKSFTQTDEEKVVQILMGNIRPRPSFTVELVQDAKGNTMVVKAPEGHEPPYYKKGKGIPGGVYVRTGSVTSQATPEDIGRLYLKRRNIGYDETAITYLSNFKPASLDMLNEAKLEKYIKTVAAGRGVNLSSISKERILDIKAAILIEDKVYPTIGGALLFCDVPNKHISELSECYIKGARFPGVKVSANIIDQKEIKGPLDIQIQEAFTFVKGHLNYGGIIKGLRREDALEIPEFILRELIINAVTHRDYSVTGATINIAIFDDRIEFNSPGGLPSGVTPQNIKDKSVIRNKIIADYLHNMKYIEKFGLGWDKIITLAEKHGIAIPEIQNLDSAVKVIVKRKYTEPSKKRASYKQKFTEGEKTVLAHLEPDKSYTLNELLKVSGVSSKTGLKQILGGLQKKGYVEVSYSGAGSVRLIR